jgi:transcriptional regulator with XRE-family HTH domain
MANQSDLATKDHDARLAAGLTQSDLATRAEMTRDQVAAIELGKRDVDALELHPLAKALGVRVLHLLGTENEIQHAPRYRNLRSTVDAADLESFARDFLRRDASLRRVLSAE